MTTVPVPDYCSANAARIVQACEKHWDAQKDNCSGFVKDVAAEFGAFLFGQANDIVDYVEKNWIKVTSGVDAALFAEAAYLVVGGLKDKPNGHVVIVVGYPLAHGKYPSAYWGTLNSEGKKNATINWAWNKTDRDKVIYRAFAIGK